MEELNVKTKTQKSEIIRNVILVIVSLIMIFPIFWLIVGSLKNPTEVMNSDIFLPTKLYWENYKTALSAAPFGLYFKNSIAFAIVSVFAQIITGSLAGYGFAKIKFKSRKIIFMLFMCSMMIPSEATITSNYLMLSSMGLMDTFFSVVATSLVSVFSVFLFRQFYLTVDNALMDAARIDGCNEIKIYLHVFMPLSTGIMSTVGIIGFINSWNSYLWPLIIVNSSELRTVQTGLRMLMQSDFGVDWGAVMAAASLIILPVIVLFVFLQKYFVQGITKVGLK
mgnify:FL=1